MLQLTIVCLAVADARAPLNCQLNARLYTVLHKNQVQQK